MGVTTDKKNKPFSPRGNDQSPKGYNRAALYSGKALDFDGVNDVITGSSSSLPASGYTITAWFNLDTLKASGIVWWGTDANGKRRAMIIWNGGSGSDWFLSADGYSTNVRGGTALETGKWYFGAVSVDSNNNAKVYLNAQEDGSGTLNLNAYTGTSYNIGKTAQSAEVTDGEISGARVFNQVLTAAQVADLYNNPEKVVPTGVDNTALKLWLPMMEGAGTTAYDGSGNGNHGTISGATYVNGIGAPVAQSAVMDWNKLYDFDGTDDLAENQSYLDMAGTKSYKVHFIAHDVNTEQQVFQLHSASTFLGVGATIDFLGSNNGILGFRAKDLNGDFGIQSWSVEANTYYELAFTINWDTSEVTSATLNGEAATGSVSCRISTSRDGLYLGSRATDFFLNGIINYFEVVGEEKWTNASGFKSESGSYDMTITGSPTQILAPQGLTTGRDITGVNLFENVRKQGALNLDGNSWAEVHDNASIDLSDANATFEAWVYHIDTGVLSQYIMNKFDGTTGVRMRTETGNNFGFYASDGTNNIADAGTFSLTANAWNHIVLTTDGTNFKRYIDGALVDTDVAGTALTTFANADSLYIGSEQTNASLAQSRIAQPRIYNRALTAEEVQRNYNAGKNTYTN